MIEQLHLLLYNFNLQLEISAALFRQLIEHFGAIKASHPLSN